MESILPVLAIIAVGYLAGKALDLDRKSLAQASLYVFTPALVFGSLVNTSTSADNVAALIGLLLVSFFLIWAAAALLARVIRIPAELRNVYTLGAIFSNSGNYGLPVVMFAYGQAAFEQGVICLIIMALLLNSCGVYVASRGNVDSTRKALKSVLTMPVMHAFVLGMACYLVQWKPPGQLMVPVALLGGAAIPLELTLLGIQLARPTPLVSSYKLIAGATFVKLLLAPMIAAALVFLFSDPGSITGKVIIVMAAAPTAVISNTLSIQFNASPEVVAGTTFITTLLSFVTVKLILMMLG